MLNLKATLQTTRFSWPIDDDNNVPAKRGSQCLSRQEGILYDPGTQDQCLQGPDIVHRPRASRLPAQWNTSDCPALKRIVPRLLGRSANVGLETPWRLF